MMPSISTHKAIAYGCLAVGLVANSLLISLVANHANSTLGRYRWLLLASALSDVITALYHAVFLPMALGEPSGFAYFSHTALLWRHSKLANQVLVLLEWEPFLLLTLHFLYRALALWKPKFLHAHFACFVRGSFVVNLLFGGLVLLLFEDVWIFTAASSPFTDRLWAEYGIPGNARVAMGYLGIHSTMNDSAKPQRTWQSARPISVTAALSLCNALVCLSCGILIHTALSSKTLKVRFRPLQAQLYHALLLQLCVPLVFVCLPFTLLIGLPHAGVDSGDLAGCFTLSACLCPALDPIIVILAVPRFKRAARQKLRAVLIRRSRNNEKLELSRLRDYYSLLVRRDTSAASVVYHDPPTISISHVSCDAASSTVMPDLPSGTTSLCSPSYHHRPSVAYSLFSERSGSFSFAWPEPHSRPTTSHAYHHHDTQF